MTYNSLYELRPRLESIYNKVERLDKLGFETKEFLDEIKMLDSKIDNIKEENNSMIGSSSYQAQDNKLINDLNALIDSFESFIDKLLLSMQIFEKNKTIELELENINDEEELNKLIPVILNNLLDLNELKKYGFNFNDENKSIFKTLYTAINKEYQFNGDSRIHNALINMNLNTELHPYIINDDTFHTKEEAERILESSENEKELLFMISLNNNKS